MNACFAVRRSIDFSKIKLGMLIILTAIVVLACCMMPRISQPQSHHLFADRRGFLGIPNFGDVVSNLPFAPIGIRGLAFLLKLARAAAPTRCETLGLWALLKVVRSHSGQY
jgi:hypothetical protein